MLSILEISIVCGIAEGLPDAEIAKEVGLSDTGIQSKVQHIMWKLNVSSRVELILFLYSADSPIKADEAAAFA